MKVKVGSSAILDPLIIAENENVAINSNHYRIFYEHRNKGKTKDDFSFAIEI